MKTIDPSSIAVYVLIAVLIMDRLLATLKTRGIDLQLMSRQIAALPKMKEQIDHIERLSEDLHVWHSVKDSDGVRVWYVRQSLEKTIAGLGRTLDKGMILMEKIDRKLEVIGNLKSKP